MADLSEAIIQYLSAGESAFGLLVLFAASLIEYVFPPFPGDTVTLFGAFLASQRGWSVPLVFIAVIAGSLAGAALDYALGAKLGKKTENELTGRALAARQKAKPLLQRFERHGVIYVAINRFLPGIRPLFFVAAGMAKLPFRMVLFWGAISAALWNTAIIAAGYAMGENWQRLLDWLERYTIVAWIAIAVIALAVIARAIWVKRRKNDLS